MRFPRNSQCPCGSGKRWKNCHGHIGGPLDKNVSAVYVDKRIKKVVMIMSNVVTNQIYRDGPLIADSFDKLARSHIEEISAVHGSIFSLICPHLIGCGYKDKEILPTCARLLASACSSIIASAELARHGYKRQCGAVLRGVVEAISVVVQISMQDGALEKFHDGKLSSTKSITFA